MNVERFGDKQFEMPSPEELAREKYGFEFDKLMSEMGGKKDLAAREKYINDQIKKRGFPQMATDEKPEGFETSRAEQGPVSAAHTQGKSSRIAGVNPDMITRPGDKKFNEEEKPSGAYSGAGVPEDLLERPHRDQPGEWRAHQ